MANVTPFEPVQAKKEEAPRGEPSCGAPAQGSGRCSVCGGVFDKATVRMADLKVGACDALGERVEELLCKTEEFVAYRSPKGVRIHFSDCRRREREQRGAYQDIGEMLCQLRFLTSQMARSWMPGRRKGHDYYDQQIAQALILAVGGKQERAKALLTEVLDLAVSRVTNENRVRYLLSCLAAGLGLVLIGQLTSWLVAGSSAGATAAPYLTAGIFGAAGAVLSIAMRVQSLELVPCRESLMNIVMGALRVLVGFASGGLILLLLTGTVLGESIQKLLTVDTIAALGTLSAQSWVSIAVLGLLAGFAERLVPNLLGSASERIDPAAQSAKTAAAGVPVPAGK